MAKPGRRYFLRKVMLLAGTIPDLRSLVATLEAAGELRRIAAEVDPNLEIAALTQKVGLSGEFGPALLFESPRGSSWQLATNLFGSSKRAALAWGGAGVEFLAAQLRRDLVKVGPGCAEQCLGRVLQQFAPPPEPNATPLWTASTGATLDTLPALRCWPLEPGRYLTLPVVVTRHPLTGALNFGLYRLQLVGSQQALIHWNAGAGAAVHHQAWSELGQAMPMAVILGAPPALLAAASMPLPASIDEAVFAGYLTGQALPCTRGPLTGLPIPVSAEIVLEGVVSAEQRGIEGPFGNHSGRYVAASPQPLFQLQGLYHRPEPILPATVVGPPPMEDCYLAQVNSRLLLPLWAWDQPQLLDIHLPLQGIFHGAALLSVPPGTGRELIARLWNSEGFCRSRLLVACPPSVDIHRPEQVYWHLLNGLDPGRDLLLDGGRLGIDGSRERPGAPVATDPVTAALVESRWKEFFPDAG